MKPEAKFWHSLILLVNHTMYLQQEENHFMYKKNIDSITHLKGEVKRDDSRTALRLKSSLRIVSCNITLSGDGNEKGQKNQ